MPAPKPQTQSACAQADYLAQGCTAPQFEDKNNLRVDALLALRSRVAAFLRSQSSAPADGPDPQVGTFLARTDRFLATRGIPEGLPLQVRQFVGFMRFLHHVTLAHHDAIVCCARKGCARLVIDPHTNVVDSTLEYWEWCRTGRPELDHDDWSPFAPSNLHFCSTACAEQTIAEFDRAVRCCGADGLNATEFVRMPRACRTRGTRGELQLHAALRDAVPPSRLHDAAIERNDKLRRRIARSSEVEPTHMRIDRRGLDALRQELVTALNIDTALLYAASVISELPSNRRPKKTMPRSLDWRKQKSFLRAILTIRNIYIDELKANPNRRPHLLTSAYDQPRWLQRVKNRLLTLF